MVVRPCVIRPTAGFSTIAKKTLGSLALTSGLLTAAAPGIAAPTGWGAGGTKSVLVQSNGGRIPAPYASQSAGQGIPAGLPIEEITPGNVATDSFDSVMPEEGVIVGSPGVDGGTDIPSAQLDRTYDTGVDGGYAMQDGYFGGADGQSPGPLPCGAPGCNGNCNACQHGSAGLPEWRYNAECEPMGLLQKMYLLHRGLKSDGCWTGRIDALILSRSAPGFRPLYTFNPTSAGNVLNANQLESIAAVGPRISLFHNNACGDAWEGTYIYSGGFVAQQNLPPTSGGYQLADPGIYGIQTPNPQGGLDTVTSRLTSSLQSAEINRRWRWGSCTQFLGGFRWLQWQESAVITDSYATGTVDAGQDLYNTNCYNNLFGGQIGLDTLLWSPSKYFRLEGLLKAGAYYNSASQSSLYATNDYSNAVNVGSSPATCSFAGELGITGVIPVCCNVDFRFGYFGLWLTSIAQPTNQLSGQQLALGDPTYGSLATNGNVVLQGLSLGLEGRW